uniref:Uncharacterized protein n=1 Tax=Anguilla anguilla TaxID=7936 RepID=A0A0E9QU14_ANGAN
MKLYSFVRKKREKITYEGTKKNSAATIQQKKKEGRERKGGRVSLSFSPSL